MGTKPATDYFSHSSPEYLLAKVYGGIRVHTGTFDPRVLLSGSSEPIGRNIVSLRDEYTL